MKLATFTKFAVENRTAILIVALLFPFVILGPFSFIQTHDNVNGIMPLAMVAGESFPHTPGWFPYVASGIPLLAQGVPFGPISALLAYLPVWPGYFIVFALQVFLGGFGTYRVCRDFLGFGMWVATLVSVLIIMKSSAPLLISTPILLAPFFAWLSVRLGEDRSFLQQLIIATLCGMAFGALSSSFLVISFWMLVGPAIIVIVSKRLWSAVFIAAVYLTTSLLPIAHEILTLSANVSESFRAFNDPVGNIELSGFAGQFLYDPFLIAAFLLIFIKGRSVATNRAAILFFLILATILAMLLVANQSGAIADRLSGFNFMRLMKPAMFLGVICSGAIISRFSAPDKRTVYLALMTVFLILPIGNHYVRYMFDSAKSWVSDGNAERFSIPQIEAIAAEFRMSEMPFRVDMVNFPLGSGFLAAYKLESAGAYVNMYPNRYRNFFADVLTPQTSGSPTGQRDGVLNWGNRINLACDNIYDGVLAMDECLDMDLVGLLNIRYVISRNPMKHENLKLVSGPTKPWNLLTTWGKIRKSIAENFGARESLYVFELKDYAPRAFVIDKVQTADDGDELSSLLRKTAFSQLLREAILLTEDFSMLPESHKWSLRNSALDIKLDAGVRSIELNGDTFNAVVDSNKTAMLVVVNSLAVGWHATVNGKDVELVPAYGTFWGIPIEAGVNRVELKYDSYRSISDVIRQVRKHALSESM